MKKITALALLFALPSVASADYVDVIAAKLNTGCSMAKYLQIVKDFNETWAKDYGYRAEVLFPLQSRDLTTIYWLGRISNASAFGKGFDAWNAAQADANSVPARLAARFRECSTNESRAGYLSY